MIRQTKTTTTTSREASQSVGFCDNDGKVLSLSLSLPLSSPGYNFPNLPSKAECMGKLMTRVGTLRTHMQWFTRKFPHKKIGVFGLTPSLMVIFFFCFFFFHAGNHDVLQRDAADLLLLHDRLALPAVSHLCGPLPRLRRLRRRRRRRQQQQQQQQQRLHLWQEVRQAAEEELPHGGRGRGDAGPGAVLPVARRLRQEEAQTGLRQVVGQRQVPRGGEGPPFPPPHQKKTDTALLGHHYLLLENF